MTLFKNPTRRPFSLGRAAVLTGLTLCSVGACKPADKGQGALKSDPVSDLSVDRTEAKGFERYFDPAPCEASEREALAALAGLGLGEDGADGISFAAREADDATITYTDLTIMAEGIDAPVYRAKQTRFHCAHLDGDQPSFDGVDMVEADVRSDEAVFTFAALNIAEPTPVAAQAIIDGMRNLERGGSGEIGFGAISASDMTVSGEGVTGSLDTLAWGETRGADDIGTADLLIENLDLSLKAEGSAPLTLAFDGMSAKNLRVGGRIDTLPDGSPQGLLLNVLRRANPFTKPYDSLSVGQISLTSSALDMEFTGLDGQSDADGEQIITTQQLKPMTLTLKPELARIRGMSEAYDALISMGYETLTLSGSSVTTTDASDDSVAVTDGRFVLEDGFVLNYEYAAEGLAETVAGLLAASNKTKEDPFAAYAPLKLRSFRLTLEDDSIVPRGMTYASERTGQSEKNLKRGLSMAVFAAAIKAENEVQAEVFTETTQAFSDFVKNGGTMTLEANPPAPFPLSPLLMGGGEDVDPDTLGFSASQADPVD